jgi:phospholipid N-methyltransferase
MQNLFHEYVTFFREVRESFHTTGAIAPSGRPLARAVASQLHARNGPRRILEVGAGTGALTREIVRHIGARDCLHIAELNERFVAILRRRFDREAAFRRAAAQTRIYHVAVQELCPDEPYDFVISGLPLNNFSSGLVREILDTFRRLLAPGGVLSFFQYLWIRDLRVPFAPLPERRRLTRVGHMINAYTRRFEFSRETVLLNLPPALVHHLRITEPRSL